MDRKARFKYKTFGILKSIFFCRICCFREYLRTKKNLRYDLYYKLGIEHLDNEMDISNILKKIRQLNYFMKMTLDKDQRKLLKIKSSKLIHSDEDEDHSIFVAQKKYDHNRMLDLYVENIRQKKLTERDQKLLRVTGLQEVIDILNSKA